MRYLEIHLNQKQVVQNSVRRNLSMAKDNLERTRNKLGSTQEFYSYSVVISYITLTYTKITEQKYFRFPGKALG